MTIIFSNHLDDDCKTITTLWENIGVPYNLVEILPTDDDYEDKVNNAIASEEDMLILVGHGTSYGLLHPNFRELLIHKRNVKLIKAKRVFCAWCYASIFCNNMRMKNTFATSMFISNIQEATYYIMCLDEDNCKQEHINNIGKHFYSDVQYLIKNNVPIKDWQMYVGARMDVEDPIDNFNRQGVMAFD